MSAQRPLIVAWSAPGDGSAGKVDEALKDPRWRLRRPRSRQALLHGAAEAACAVVASHTAPDRTGLAVLDDLSAAYPLLPIVLVSARSAAVARRTEHLRLAEIVWLGEVGRELPGAVDRALASRPLARWAREIASGGGGWIPCCAARSI